MTRLRGVTRLTVTPRSLANVLGPGPPNMRLNRRHGYLHQEMLEPVLRWITGHREDIAFEQVSPTEVKWSYDEQTVAKPDEHHLASRNLDTHRSNRVSKGILEVRMGVSRSSQRVRRVSYRTHSKKSSYYAVTTSGRSISCLDCYGNPIA